MKNSVKFISYAAAAVAMVSCSNKSLVPAVSDAETVNVKIHAGAIQTKTGIEFVDEGGVSLYAPYWNKGDKISVVFDTFEGKTAPEATLTNVADDESKSADFSGEVKLSLKAEGTVYSFYPSSAYQSGSFKAADRTVRVDLPSNQHPKKFDNFDPAADILVGQPSDYLFGEGTLVADVNFARAMSVLRFNLIAGEGCPSDLCVNSLKFEVPSNITLTGRVTLSLAPLFDDASPLGNWTVENPAVTLTFDNEKPIIGNAGADPTSVFAIVKPTTIPAGSTVKFIIDTDTHNVEKEVVLSKEISFPQGSSAEINLTILGSNCTPKQSETRILVESFKNTPALDKNQDRKEQMSASATGVTGTGVSEKLEYYYSTTNTNIRMNGNGQSGDNPYLWISGSDQYMMMSNIVVNDETTLKFSFKTKTIQGAATVTIKYKDSSLETWNIAGTGNSTTSKWNDCVLIFDIPSSTESLDLQIIGSAGNLMVDDIVLEKFVDTRTQLATPAGLKAALDAEAANKINVSWNAVENASAYSVVLSAAGKEDVVKTATETAIAVDGLAYETTYSVKVKAVSSDLEKYKDSEYTTSVNVTTGENPGSDPFYEDPVTATIKFGTNDVKINAASVTGNDDKGNIWTITTAGTTSFTANNAYYQVGSSSKPATSITFTTTLPKNAKVTAMSAKFGGFNGTAGTVTLKVGDESLGTGSLNAANDVTVSVSDKNEVGKVLTVTLTKISKGVKVYNISATYQLEK